MRDRRTGKKGGFYRLGDLDLRQVGFPARRSRDLELSLAWRRIAGAALSQRSRVTGARRGILDIQVADRRWERAIRPMLPDLAGRMASACPGFRIRRCRLLLASSTGEPENRAMIDVEPVGDTAAGPVSEAESTQPKAIPDPAEVAREYLRNAARRRDRR